MPLPGGGAGETPGHFHDNTAYGAGFTYSTGSFGNAIAYDQWNPVAGPRKTAAARKAGAAASFALGSFKIMAGYRWGQSKDGLGNTLVPDDYYWVGGNYLVAPAANPWQISSSADYILSKRTDIYLTMAYAKNSARISTPRPTALPTPIS